MSATAGRNGEITLKLPSADLGTPGGSDVIMGQIRSWSIEDAVETLDTTVMSGSTGFIFRSNTPSFKTWTITVDFIYDKADAAQANERFKAGNDTIITIYPEGEATATADKYFSGTGLITSLSRSASYDGLIECSITVEGKSALAYSTDVAA